MKLGSAVPGQFRSVKSVYLVVESAPDLVVVLDLKDLSARIQSPACCYAVHLRRPRLALRDEFKTRLGCLLSVGGFGRLVEPTDRYASDLERIQSRVLAVG